MFTFFGDESITNFPKLFPFAGYFGRIIRILVATELTSYAILVSLNKLSCWETTANMTSWISLGGNESSMFVRIFKRIVFTSPLIYIYIYIYMIT